MKKMPVIFTMVLLFVTIFPAAAQRIEELYSPFFFSIGPQSAVSEAPASDLFNPASSALEQRIRLNLGYMGIIGSETDPGWGHAVNAGVSIPTNAGVLTFNGNFISSPLTTIQLGTLGGLHVTFSKDLFPNLLVGIGINGMYGGQSGVTDWGLGGDLGFIHKAGDLFFIKDFSWGIAMRNMGKAYAPAASSAWFPKAFTPAIAASFKVFKSDPLSLGLLIDISSPGFENILLYTAAEIDILHTALLRASFQTDYISLFKTPSTRFPAAFGFSIVFKLDLDENVEFIKERGWSQNDIKVNMAFAPISNGIMAGGAELNVALGMKDERPPQIRITPETPEASAQIPDDDPDKDTLYVSPNLDGTQDNLELPITIEDERFVKGYKLVITDDHGTIIKIIENKEERPENLELDNIVNRILYVKRGVTVPDKLIWDGKKDDGSVVEDGAYTYHVEAWDDNNNKTETQKKKVIIDNTAPSVEQKANYLVFSPNNDGNKDTLPLKITGTKEDKWSGQITDARGTPVKTFTWENKQPADLAWDGTNDAGILAADGVYSFAISSMDRAGNKTVQKTDNIIISTVATPINMTVDTAFFSPNNDKASDVVNFSLSIGVTSGIEKWSLAITDKNNKNVRTFSGTDKIDTAFVFDGKDDSNTLLPEGTYTATLDVLYINGNNPKVGAPAIVLDLTPPAVTLAADNSVFSPNNDGKKDFVTISITASQENIWTGEIIDKKTGKAVKTYYWKGKPDTKLVWGGQGDEGALLEDGEYVLSISATDSAGNSFRSTGLALTINTEETPVLFSANLEAFSPNDDKVKDTIIFSPQLKISSNISTYTLLVKAKNGRAIKSLSGKGKPPQTFTWNGIQDAGTLAADGAYFAELNILYENGNNPIAKTAEFIIDTVKPTVTAAAAYTLFSPDNDRQKDTLPIQQKTSSEALWEAIFADSSGRIVKSIYWKGQATDIEWDGKDLNGNRLPDGKYSYTISATDNAGNSAEAVIGNIEIDITPTPVFITLDNEAFSPNADKVKDTLPITVYIEVTKGITTWSVDLVHKTKGTQKTFRGTGEDLKESLIWDGKTNNNQAAPDGEYTALINVAYKKGNTPKETSTPFFLDTAAPDVDLKLNPLPFSPDNDGMEDELEIQTNVKDLTGIKTWKMDIIDPAGTLFTSFSGAGIPSRKIIWNGMSSRNELVQAASDYGFVLTITDNVGNTTEIKKVIPIDVLVIRDGDKLYIRIPSITFAPNTADYTNVKKEAYDKNIWTIERLAQIFKKYSSYHILIEGHAVSVFWYDPARSEKEQREELLPLSKNRADAIKQALVKHGIDANRISTEGVGASRPIIPFKDEENRWKNRRVEFILLKN